MLNIVLNYKNTNSNNLSTYDMFHYGHIISGKYLYIKNMHLLKCKTNIETHNFSCLIFFYGTNHSYI